jgi:hypothetical protein
MVRTFFIASLALAGIAFVAAPARAADGDVATADAASVLTVTRGASIPARGPILPVLYGTLAGLQAYDGWSTVRAVRLGATEANPAVAGIASNAGAMWALKAGTTMTSIYVAERLWRRQRRVEAIVTMVAVNGMMAMVATHNASVMRGLK